MRFDWCELLSAGRSQGSGLPAAKLRKAEYVVKALRGLSSPCSQRVRAVAPHMVRRWLPCFVAQQFYSALPLHLLLGTCLCLQVRVKADILALVAGKDAELIGAGGAVPALLRLLHCSNLYVRHRAQPHSTRTRSPSMTRRTLGRLLLTRLC